MPLLSGVGVEELTSWQSVGWKDSLPCPLNSSTSLLSGFHSGIAEDFNGKNGSLLPYMRYLCPLFKLFSKTFSCKKEIKSM